MGKIILPRLAWLVLTGLILSPSPLPAADATLTVTKEQAGREIALKVGDVLLIELPGKGGTGYSWFAQASGAPYLKLMDQTTRQLKEGLLGGPVMQVWRFKAAQPGETWVPLIRTGGFLPIFIRLNGLGGNPRHLTLCIRALHVFLVNFVNLAIFRLDSSVMAAGLSKGTANGAK